MSWINDGVDREAMLAAVPNFAAKFSALYGSFWDQSHIDIATLELCRLRLAQLHGSDVDWRREDVLLDKGKRENLAGWVNTGAYSYAERACLEFTEVYAIDAQSISDDQAAAVKQHYGDAGLVTLVEALGIFDGMTRLSLLWQLPADGSS